MSRARGEARAIRRAVDSETEACARDVCAYCAGKWSGIFLPTPQWRGEPSPMWGHPVLSGNFDDGWVPCGADAIWQRVARERP